MQDYYTKAIEALQLAGMSDRTQRCYARSVLQLVDHCGKTLDLITEEQLKDYFLHKINESDRVPVTVKRWALVVTSAAQHRHSGRSLRTTSTAKG